MFNADEATNERVDAYVEALEVEKHGLEQRLIGAKGDRDLEAQLKRRVGEVDAELKRARSSSSSSSKGKRKPAADDAGDAGAGDDQGDAAA